MPEGIKPQGSDLGPARIENLARNLIRERLRTELGEKFFAEHVTEDQIAQQASQVHEREYEEAYAMTHEELKGLLQSGNSIKNAVEAIIKIHSDKFPT